MRRRDFIAFVIGGPSCLSPAPTILRAQQAEHTRRLEVLMIQSRKNPKATVVLVRAFLDKD